MSADFYLGILAGIGLSLIGSWVWARGQFRRQHRSPSVPTDSPGPEFSTATPPPDFPARPDA